MVQTTQGRKYDSGKLRYDLVPVMALEEVTKVITLGAEKYDPENWKHVPEGRRRYTAAAFRHIEAWRNGETVDEIGTHHIANAISNLMFILEKELRGWDDVASEQSEKKLLKMWCDTCEGVGHYDNRGLGIPRELYDAECPCPDCDGKGYVEVVVQGSSIKSNPESPWYPDNSGEWIEYDGSGQPVEDGVRVEVMLAAERLNRDYVVLVREAESWDWEAWVRRGGNVVAYKVCKTQ